MKKFRIILSVILLVSSVSCTKRELRTELRRLDRIIENREEYLNDFNVRVSLLRDSLSMTDSDSLAWVFSYRLFDNYLRFSTDSAEVYLEKMEIYAALCSSPRMDYYSIASRLQLDIARNSLHDATITFNRIDTLGLNLSKGEVFDYYNRAGAYYVLLRDASVGNQFEDAKRMVNMMRHKAVGIDSLSATGRKMRAILYNQQKDYRRSLETLLPCWSWDSLSNLDRSITAYNIASIYKQMGDEYQQMIWLARSAQYDYMAPVNNYLSVYHLAILLHKHRMFERSQRYINLNLSDIIEANYQQRIRRSGEVQIMISSATHRIQTRRTAIISISCLAFLLMSIILVSLLRKNKSLYNLAEEKNSQLLNVNRKLEEVNTIKDEYLFKYMGLSTQYLIQIEETRHELRQIAKTEGIDAMMKKLRCHGNTDEELEKFFKVFDETFLSIFPDFVEKVNAMLREDCRFCLKKGNELPTELRILATMRLGMKESGRIAEFLNCAPATVYTYKTKILNMALCEKDQFVPRLMEITSY